MNYCTQRSGSAEPPITLQCPLAAATSRLHEPVGAPWKIVQTPLPPASMEQVPFPPKGMSKAEQDTEPAKEAILVVQKLRSEAPALMTEHTPVNELEHWAIVVLTSEAEHC